MTSSADMDSRFRGNDEAGGDDRRNDQSPDDDPAPVAARVEQRIAAPPQTVWQVLTDVEGWPNWHDGVVDVSVKGPVEPGTRFVWRSGGFKVRSRFESVAPRERVVWSGKTTGAHLRHVWSIEAHGEGCLVHTEQSLRGWLPRLFRGRFQPSLQAGLESWVRSLRLKCEGMQIEADLSSEYES